MSTALWELASGILKTEFDNDTGVATTGAISGWLFENLGRLNTHIYTDFAGYTATGANGTIDKEAQNILKELYLYNYYTKEARNSLRGIVNSNVSGDNILSLKDGESSLTFVNRNEVSKVYRGLASDSMANVERLSAQYNIYQAEPLQLGGVDGSGDNASIYPPY